jgi:hypothetical protein
MGKMFMWEEFDSLTIMYSHFLLVFSAELLPKDCQINESLLGELRFAVDKLYLKGVHL